MNTPLFAHFDGEHIRLDNPIPLPQNAALLVYLLPSGNDDLDPLRTVAEMNFARAYSDDEPDYSIDDVKQ